MPAVNPLDLINDHQAMFYREERAILQDEQNRSDELKQIAGAIRYGNHRRKVLSGYYKAKRSGNLGRGKKRNAKSSQA